MPNDVKQEVPVEEPIAPAEVIPELPAEPKPGEKTEPSLLLKSLQEEREKRRIAEEEVAKKDRELQELKDAAGNAGEPLSEEGQLLKRQIDDLKSKLDKTEADKQLDALRATHPALKDKADEFEAYRTDPNNKGLSLGTAAKGFLLENDLLASPAPARKGLEEGSGGSHAPPKQGMSPEDIDDLRKNNYRKYADMIRKGEINI